MDKAETWLYRPDFLDLDQSAIAPPRVASFYMRAALIVAAAAGLYVALSPTVAPAHNWHDDPPPYQAPTALTS